MADNSLALEKLQKEHKDLEAERVKLQNQLYALTGAINFCNYLIGVITKGPEKESLNGPDPEPNERQPDERQHAAEPGSPNNQPGDNPEVNPFFAE